MSMFAALSQLPTSGDRRDGGGGGGGNHPKQTAAVVAVNGAWRLLSSPPRFLTHRARGNSRNPLAPPRSTLRDSSPA